MSRKLPWRIRLAMAWRVVRGSPVGFRLNILSTGDLYIQQDPRGVGVVECRFHLNFQGAPSPREQWLSVNDLMLTQTYGARPRE